MKETGHADSYDQLSINYIPGHVPELVTFDKDDQEIERIKLAPFSTDALHELVREKGFKKKEEL